MDELKPCPFCGGEAKIVKDNNDAPFKWIVECKNCQTTSGLATSKKHAAFIWNDRIAPDNPPLTLEQLRQMDRNPVWIGQEFSEWMQIEHCINGYQHYHQECFIGWCFCVEEPTLLKLKSYGKTWLAYARKPDQEAQP